MTAPYKERCGIVDKKQALEFLKTHDNYTILTHKNPDGDTLGSGFGLCQYLRQIGKKANVKNNEPFPARYDFMYENYYEMDFEEETVVAVDVADTNLLGDNLSSYAQKVDLCIDHHISNHFYAKDTLLDADASAACLVIYQMLKEGGCEISKLVATCLYTGISTDTGCFKFENTIPAAHIAAAELLPYVDYAAINRKMFDVKSRGRMMVEQAVMADMEFYLDDKISLITVTTALMQSSGVDEAEFDGLASLTLQVESVIAGVTIKQRGENRYKISIRSTPGVDACAVCATLGGGGHKRAAGCEIFGTLDEAKATIINAIKEHLDGGTSEE